MALKKIQEFRLDSNYMVACNDGGGGGVPLHVTDPDGYTIGVDTVELDSAIDTLATETTKVSNAITEIFRLIDVELVKHWSGESYETFKTKCHTYKVPVEQIVTFLTAYKELLDLAYTNAETLTKSVSDSIQ